MIKIGIAGVPGSGKTTLARAVAAELRARINVSAEYVAEYAREYIQKQGPIAHLWEQKHIIEQQLRRESAFQRCKVLVTDSPVFLGYGYSMNLYTGGAKSRVIMEDIYRMLLEANDPQRYDMIYFLPPAWEPIQDGVRPESNFLPSWRAQMDRRLRAAFDVFPPREIVTMEPTNLKDRVDVVLTDVNAMLTRQMIV